MRTGFRRGFTLIEMLVVIAIIAVLAAILFPVFSRVKENARQATCLSNMHAIYQAVTMFKNDNNDYPPALLGYAERPDGLPWQPGDAGPVEADQIKHSPIMAYIPGKRLETFHCPDNIEKNLARTVTALFPANTAWTGNAVFGRAGFNFKNLPGTYADQPIYFYAYDSYSLTAAMNASGQRIGSDFHVAYARDWTGGAGVQDAPNQTKYRNAPGDKTVLTWCNYHVLTAGADQCPVLLLSGTARPRPYRSVVEQTWQVANAP